VKLNERKTCKFTQTFRRVAAIAPNRSLWAANFISNTVIYNYNSLIFDFKKLINLNFSLLSISFAV
jgi:hypothetical protein